MIRRLLVALLAVASATTVSCKVNQYCLNCDLGDAGRDAGSAVDANDGGNDAGSGSCVPSPEICDGSDNDCDGIIDEDATGSDIGSACPNQKGDCSGGVLACIAGKVQCNKLGSAEICDGRDNDCDGVIDNGDPGGGASCGTSVGNCVAGANHCVSGSVQCVGAIGGSAETCNGQDDDCDGRFDEGLADLGPCGVSNVGACKLGVLSCIGGGVLCEGAVLPTFEICNGLDDDCDGVIDNGFDLQTDPENCGMCGNVCHVAHAFAGCGGTPAACTIAACQSGFHDNNHNPADGCEFGPCTITGSEVCNGLDDDCDGTIDDNLGAAPAICLTKGACAGAVAQCEGSNGYVCDYGPGVSTDGDGNVISETACDGIDNDCDGKIDEGQPNLGEACHDTGIGACQGTGHFACDAANPNGPAICVIDHPGVAPTAESCDNIDNDCDGKIDEGGSNGSLIGQDWIAIGNNKQMMEYEVSRPDATGSGAGSIATFACSKPGVLPWENVKYPDALAACESVGATLCNEQDWHRTCSVVSPTTYPIALPATGTVTQLVEAEDYFANVNATDINGVIHSWIEDYETDSNGRTWSGISDLQAVPIVGINTANADAATHAPHLDFKFTMGKASSKYTVWVLIDSPKQATDRVAVAFDGAAVTGTMSNGTANTWVWEQSAQFTLAAGTHTLNLYMMRDGVRVDAIEITDGGGTPSLPSNPPGNTWSYATSPDTHQTGVCDDSSFAGGATIPTGTDTNCHTTTGVFDQSGNVKEWALAHQPGQNPIRGGAANNDDNGTTCALNFTLADDTFFFPNVGFRCCRVAP